jgi:hypothetical protein
MNHLNQESFFGGQIDVVIDQMVAATTECDKFCRDWRDSNKEQAECLGGFTARLVYSVYIGPGKYDIAVELSRGAKRKMHNWFGSACCRYSAEAKAYQDLF